MLRIYNTATRKTEDFVPIKDNVVKMYVCGPTVYSHIHIGNARPVIFFDMLKKYLEYNNYEVYYVSNITDVDDKIIQEAKKLKITEKELTNEFTKAFIEASTKVGSALPDFMPKATDYIDSMIKFIQELIEKGYAYKTNSGVYFDTMKIAEYGMISGQQIDELTANVRIENKGDKKDFRDFNLWKTTNEGIAFKSPWGEGRPGWHTECAVMNNDIFGDMIDIHGGGSDLIFPHHENENVQTVAHNDHGLAKYWMHVGRVDFANNKMSKSLGNTILVKDLESPLSYRLLILAHHYRTPINYNEDLKNEFIEMYDKIVRTIKRAHIKIGLVNFNKILPEYLERFKTAMDNDLNTPNAVTVILELVKDLNKTEDVARLEELLGTLLKVLDIFSLVPEYNLTEELVLTYKKWNEARQNKQYAEADILRKKLIEEGWI